MLDKNKELSSQVKAATKVIRSHGSKDADVLSYDRKWLKETFNPECLPEGSELTEKLFKEAQDHSSNMLAAAKYAFGQDSVELLDKNKSFDVVRGKVPMGSDAVEYKMKREGFSRNPQSGEVKAVPGQISTIYKKRGTKGTGETSKVNVLLSGLTEEKLG